MGMRSTIWSATAGVPRGARGRAGARMMVRLNAHTYALLAQALELGPDDDVLDVGCGSGVLLASHAHVARHVAGLDASPIQLELARRRLAARIEAGTAEILMGDAARLPWPDERFSVVTSLHCIKFLPDPPAALREMWRVLRPGGRAVLGMCDRLPRRHVSGARDAWGQWGWDEHAAQRLVSDAGFSDVTATVLGRPACQVVRAHKA